MIEQVITNLKPCIGQRLGGIRQKDDELWLVFEKDFISVKLINIECKCLGCEEKNGN